MHNFVNEAVLTIVYIYCSNGIQIAASFERNLLIALILRPCLHIIMTTAIVKFLYNSICNLAKLRLIFVASQPKAEYLASILDPNANPQGRLLV